MIKMKKLLFILHTISLEPHKNCTVGIQICNMSNEKHVFMYVYVSDIHKVTFNVH